MRIPLVFLIDFGSAQLDDFYLKIIYRGNDDVRNVHREDASHFKENLHCIYQNAQLVDRNL